MDVPYDAIKDCKPVLYYKSKRAGIRHIRNRHSGWFCKLPAFFRHKRKNGVRPALAGFT